MDIVQLIKREHNKISGFFDKLTDTSDGAVKTRERLFSELKTDLEVHANVVQDHIYPLLRKSDETRGLVPELKERNELKRQLADLDRTPKSDESFLPKLKELRKAVEQHLRAEERQIFPAIKKAIGGEEAEALAKRIAAETREGLDEAKQHADTGAEEAVARTAEVVSIGAQRTLEEVGETAETITKTATAGSRRLAGAAAGQASQVGHGALRAAETYTEAGRRATESLSAFQAVPSAAMDTLQEVQRVWMDWVGEIVQMSTRASQDLVRCSSLPQIAKVQSEFMAESLKAWVEGGARVLQAAQRSSQATMQTIEHRRSSQARRNDAA